MNRTNRSVALLAGIAAIALTASAAGAQATTKHETQAQLRAEAKIPMATAKATALAKVPGGRVKSSELERENGHLLYSFDIATKGKPGIDEVQIDALTGAQIGSVVHETPKDEKNEAKAEAREAKAAKKMKKAESAKP
jgi:uncharacterized membrane protein YkoI